VSDPTCSGDGRERILPAERRRRKQYRGERERQRNRRDLPTPMHLQRRSRVLWLVVTMPATGPDEDSECGQRHKAAPNDHDEQCRQRSARRTRVHRRRTVQRRAARQRDDSHQDNHAARHAGRYKPPLESLSREHRTRRAGLVSGNGP
jgi:hypothetical protein